MSLTVSLVAVLIPLLFMSGILFADRLGIGGFARPNLRHKFEMQRKARTGDG